MELWVKVFGYVYLILQSFLKNVFVVYVMYVCVCTYLCVCICVCKWKLEVTVKHFPVTLHSGFETKYLTEPGGQEFS